MEEISFIEVDKNNYKKAIEIQQELFPYEKGDSDILESIGRKKKTYAFLRYFLVKHKTNYIGITGLYSYDIYPEDAWLTWAGLLPKFDNDVINDICLEFVKKFAKEKGYRHLRVYSDEIADKEDNDDYLRIGMIREEYKNEKNKFYSVGKTFIFSISLTKEPTQLWKDKCLYLEAHEKRNNIEKESDNFEVLLDKVTFLPITQENHKIAIRIQQSIFPLESGKQDILESLEEKKKNFDFLKYWLICYEEKYIGITGIYTHYEYPKEAWLAWFGILPEYRRKGIGSKALQFTKKQAQKLKFNSFRVYTDSNLNHYACHLYDKFFEHKEVYLNEKGKYYSVGDTLIYSASLTNKPVEPWNDKCIFLENHEKNNNSYTLKYHPIDEENLEIAGLVQYEIFNESHSVGYLDYVKEVKDRNKNKKTLLPLDYLVYYRKEPIGVIGLYEIEGNPDDIWLNWFGVLPKFRKHGFGTQMLLYVLEKAKEMGKKNFRLFTYSIWHAKAQGIYKRTMKLEERYTNKDDDQYCIEQGKPKIFSISLTDRTVEKWKNKFIDLASEKKLHLQSIKRMMKDGLFKKQ